MNLFILNKSNGKFYYKPDTTLCRENADFYIPDYINSLNIQSGVAVKIVKSGRCISSKFAERYYRNINFAVNIFHRNILNTTIHIEDLAHFSSLEHSLYCIEKQSCNQSSISFNTLYLSNGSETIEFYLGSDLKSSLNSAIENISSVFSLKSGDLIIVVEDSSVEIKRGDIVKLTACDSDYNYVKLLDFSIK
jgi:2-keto-4-pentenoate hydratase/2-oxohepta-3-ene-1,7-dioic acid hydratase in catechol pathway